jgi:hypothetical protein
MKKLSLLILFTIFTTIAVTAQDETQTQTRVKEVGFYTNTLKDLSGIGIRYKFGSEKMMYRVTAVSLKTGSYKTINPDQKTTTFGGGLYAGIEKPVLINKRLNLYWGPQIGGSFSNSKTTGFYYLNKQKNFTGSLGLIVGVSFKVIDQIYIALETVPSLVYTWIGTKGNSDPEYTSISNSRNFSINSFGNSGLIIGIRF